MKNYGNIVKQYVSKKDSAKYKNIEAENEIEYMKKQVVDIKKFVKSLDLDPLSPNNIRTGNPSDYVKNLKVHKKILDAEAVRMDAQIKRAVPKDK